MRLVYKMYPDQKYSLVKTDNRGENPQVIDGEAVRRGVKRLAAYIEVSCDDTGPVVDQVRTALDKLKTNLSTIGDP